MMGQTETAELLIEKGIDVNAADNIYKFTALALASGQGHTDTAELLITKGADINNNSNRTALMNASRNGHTETAELLITKGAEVNAVNEFGRTALMDASSEGHTETAIFLIEKGADVSAVSDDGTTALKLATENRHAEIVELLNKEIRTENMLIIILIVFTIAILILMIKGEAINKRIGFKISGVLVIVLVAVLVLLEFLNSANTVENNLSIIRGILLVLFLILIYQGEAINKRIGFNISVPLGIVLFATFWLIRLF